MLFVHILFDSHDQSVAVGLFVHLHRQTCKGIKQDFEVATVGCAYKHDETFFR